MRIDANSSTIIQLVYKSLAENTQKNQELPKVQHAWSKQGMKGIKKGKKSILKITKTTFQLHIFSL